MIWQLLRRNLRVYFRDKASVFFSMLGVIIIIGLYLAFLGNMVADAGAAAGENARFMMDSWIMGGVISAASITTAMGAFGIMVEDTAKNLIKDFQVSPIKRWQLVLAYVLGAITIGIIMSCFTLALAEVYILINGGTLLSFSTLMQMLATIVLAVSASSAFVFFITCFVKTSNAFSTVSTLLGTLIGFLTGVYVPMGVLPPAIQTVIRFFPVSHSAVLFRRIMISQAIDLQYIPTEINQFLGNEFWYGDTLMPVWGHIIVLVATTVIFFGLSILVVSRKKHKQ
ncbi:MAG: ABC transporter permease [bacterium]